MVDLKLRREETQDSDSKNNTSSSTLWCKGGWKHLYALKENKQLCFYTLEKVKKTLGCKGTSLTPALTICQALETNRTSEITLHNPAAPHQGIIVMFRFSCLRCTTLFRQKKQGTPAHGTQFWSEFYTQYQRDRCPFSRCLTTLLSLPVGTQGIHQIGCLTQTKCNLSAISECTSFHGGYI